VRAGARRARAPAGPCRVMRRTADLRAVGAGSTEGHRGYRSRGSRASRVLDNARRPRIVSMAFTGEVGATPSVVAMKKSPLVAKWRSPLVAS
jgi:hypothetical protein